MEKIFEIARKFRVILFVITIVAFVVLGLSKCQAFWPPDMVPHIDLPELPTKPENPYDDGTS